MTEKKKAPEVKKGNENGNSQKVPAEVKKGNEPKKPNFKDFSDRIIVCRIAN